MIRRPPRSTPLYSSAASDVYKRQVRDNGAGIDPRHQSHLFEPGYRIESQPAHSFSGMGIRLSLMKDVITAQGGKLWVESQPGRGSTFHFTLIPVRGSLRA